MTLNCRPGQLATIVRGCQMHTCISERLGCVVQVSHLVTPTSLIGSLMEAVDGPAWELQQRVSCPSGECEGIRLVPDRCLKPYDPDSEPKDEAQDQPVVIGVDLASGPDQHVVIEVGVDG